MGKQQQDPIELAPNQADVRKFIEEEPDFGFELQVGRLFAKAKVIAPNIVEPEHGGTYTDSSTLRPRQFDFRGRILRQIFNDHYFCASLAVECKNLAAAHPLVINGTFRTKVESWHVFVESCFDGAATNGVGRRDLVSSGFYPTDEFVGKCPIRYRLKNKEDEVYDRWAQAVQSSHDLANDAQLIARELKLQRVSTIILPVVVIPNGSLWIAEYGTDCRPVGDPYQKDQATFYVGRKFWLGDPKDHSVLAKPTNRFAISHVHFATLNGFSKLLDGLSNDPSVLEKLIPSGGVTYPFTG